MKRDAPACCAFLYPKVMIFPSVNATCCQSEILDRMGCMYDYVLGLMPFVKYKLRTGCMPADAEVGNLFLLVQSTLKIMDELCFFASS